MIAVTNAAAPPKITVKTGFSLSIIRLQTRFTGRIMSGLNRNEPTKVIDRKVLNIFGNITNRVKANSIEFKLKYRFINPIGILVGGTDFASVNSKSIWDIILCGNNLHSSYSS